MFHDAAAFNQDIGAWEVCSVTDMNGLFEWRRDSTGVTAAVIVQLSDAKPHAEPSPRRQHLALALARTSTGTRNRACRSPMLEAQEEWPDG